MFRNYIKFYIYVIFITTLIFAKGTKAGYIVKNSAVANYNLNGINYSLNSNEDKFVVDKVVDIKLNSQDTKAVEVSANEKGRVLTFILTNSGNSEDNVTLNYEHNSSSNFKVQSPKIFIDLNANSIFDKNDSEVNSTISLKMDESKTLFIVANIPSDVKIKEKSIDGILAKSTAKASSGADRKDKVDVVIRRAKALDFGEYIVRDYWLESKKSSFVISDDNKTHTGSTIRYEIDVKIGGNNENKLIKNLILKDEIPKDTKYINNSLKLNSKSLTDKNDSDEGYFDGERVVVNIGDIKNDEVKKVTFDVIVK